MSEINSYTRLTKGETSKSAILVFLMSRMVNRPSDFVDNEVMNVASRYSSVKDFSAVVSNSEILVSYKFKTYKLINNSVLKTVIGVL